MSLSSAHQQNVIDNSPNSTLGQQYLNPTLRLEVRLSDRSTLSPTAVKSNEMLNLQRLRQIIVSKDIHQSPTSILEHRPFPNSDIPLACITQLNSQFVSQDNHLVPWCNFIVGQTCFVVRAGTLLVQYSPHVLQSFICSFLRVTMIQRDCRQGYDFNRDCSINGESATQSKLHHCYHYENGQAAERSLER